MVNVKDRMPKVAGEYSVITNIGKSIAFLNRDLKGEFKWICINKDYEVLQWKEDY